MNEALVMYSTTNISVEWKKIYYSNNHNAYNQVTKIINLNFNWAMVYAYSYSSPK